MPSRLETNITFYSWIIQLLTFWVAYSHLIPISLYVIIEMLKLTQAYLISKDVQMYDKETEKFGLCRNSDLIEELGQVDFIFSDKTGTLTQNKMIFKKCSVNNVVFEESQDETNCKQDENMISPFLLRRFNSVLYDEQSLKSKQSEMLNLFFLHLSVCHTVMVEKETKGNDV